MLRAGLVLLVLGSLTGCVTLQPGEAGILFSPFKAEQNTQVLREGSHPVGLWDSVIIYDLRWQTQTEKVHIHTSDKLHMEVAASITFRPKGDKLNELHRTLGKEYYGKVVQPLFVSALRREFARHPYDVLFPKSGELQAAILEQVQQGLQPTGIEVASISLVDIDYPAETEQALARQMALVQELKNKDLQLTAAQKDAEVEAAKSKGQSEARLAREDAERAIADKEAEITLIRARAEAQAAKAREAGLSPMYLKLRTIEAQEKLAASGASKIYFMPSGKDGVPVVFHLQDEKP